ncbi:MAG: cation transporter [Deltaproteobacteria bacterium]|nr:cation transporter [Deltaproteobacteria bacterium]
MNSTEGEHGRGTPKWGLVGAVAAAVGASVCCLGPLLLLAVGVGGAWIGNLTAMERYRPYWMAATLVSLGLAFFRVYRKPKEVACTPGSACSTDGGRRNKFIFWIVTALVLGLLALPYMISYAYAGGPEETAVTRQVILSVRNMTCSACVVTVKKSLARVEGVKDAKVTSSPSQAVVTYDPVKVRVEPLVEATTKAGFPSMILAEGGKR